jgi:PemK-like, MazF-like toxin of type II toxin-antitoxin system
MPNPVHGPKPPDSGWPIPEPGDVLSYFYLWAREAEKGQDEGLKDRPVVVVVARIESKGRTEVIVAPVTHSAPDHEPNALEMPANVKHDLRLDRDRSWIVLTEMNRFNWPGPDIRPVYNGGNPYYGAIPDWLLLSVRNTIGERARIGRMKVTKRGN